MVSNESPYTTPISE